MKQYLNLRVLALVLLSLLATACGKREDGGPGARAGAEFTVCMSSEQSAFKQDVIDIGKQNGKTVTIIMMGSVDLVNELTAKGKDISCDALWVASGQLVAQGDKQKVVKDMQSIAWSPVLPIVRRDVAEAKGWLKPGFSYKQFFTAVQSGLPFAMTNPTQSFSGLAGYMAFLQVLANKEGDPVISSDLAKDELRKVTRQVLGKIDRTSTSSGLLKDQLVANSEKFQAMVNYEAMAWEANQALAAKGVEYCALAPAEGTVIADFPFGYVEKGDAAKRQLFDAMKTHLTSPAFKDKMKANGRRIGLGMLAEAKTTLDSCFDTAREVRIMPTSTPAVVDEALTLYQEDLRRPTDLYLVADYSGSMRTNGGEVALKNAMGLLYDQTNARRLKLQHHPMDRSTLIPFNGGVIGKEFSVSGNKPADLQVFLNSIKALSADGGTNAYAGIKLALALAKKNEADNVAKNRRVAIVLLTDGESDTGELVSARSAYAGTNIPVYSIAFSRGADVTQLYGIASWQTADTGLQKKLVCSSNTEEELISCFRRMRGEAS